MKLIYFMFKTFLPVLFNNCLSQLPSGKLLISTINSYSFIVSKRNNKFHDALVASNILLPDGIGIVLAYKLFMRKNMKKIAGMDWFKYEMKLLNEKSGKCFFLGSSDETLKKIKLKLNDEYPNVQVSFFSPPYKNNFDKVDTCRMLYVVNGFNPDVLFIGMTAPKQEIWAAENFDLIKANHICSIGAVFDFYAGNIKRAPNWVINFGFEWLYRLLKEPRRLWRRYLIGNSKFIFSIFYEFLWIRN